MDTYKISHWFEQTLVRTLRCTSQLFEIDGRCSSYDDQSSYLGGPLQPSFMDVVQHATRGRRNRVVNQIYFSKPDTSLSSFLFLRAINSRGIIDRTTSDGIRPTNSMSITDLKILGPFITSHCTLCSILPSKMVITRLSVDLTQKLYYKSVGWRIGQVMKHLSLDHQSEDRSMNRMETSVVPIFSYDLG